MRARSAPTSESTSRGRPARKTQAQERALRTGVPVILFQMVEIGPGPDFPGFFDETKLPRLHGPCFHGSLVRQLEGPCGSLVRAVEAVGLRGAGAEYRIASSRRLRERQMGVAEQPQAHARFSELPRPHGKIAAVHVGGKPFEASVRNPDMVTGSRVAGRRAHPPDRVLLGMLRRAGTGVETGVQVVRGERIRSGLVEEEHRISGSVPEPSPQLVIAGDIVVVSRA